MDFGDKWADDLLVGADSTLYLRTKVGNVEQNIPIQNLVCTHSNINATNSSSQADIQTISNFTKKMTGGKVDFAQRVKPGGEWANDLLVGSESTLYLRTAVNSKIISIRYLAAATSREEFTFTEEEYATDWQLYTLAAGWDGQAGHLEPYTAKFSGEDFSANQVDICYKDILLSLCRTEVLSTALNPGGFSDAEIVVRHGLAEASLASLKTAVQERFPDSKGKITYIVLEDPKPSGHILVFQNVWSNFQILQKGSAGAKDVFKRKASVKHARLNKNKIPDIGRMDSLNNTLSLCTLSNKPPLKSAKLMMGCEAQAYANESVGRKAKNQYAWGYRHAPALVVAPHNPTNIVCATVQAQSWMHIYALIARICVQNKRDRFSQVSFSSRCNRAGDFEPNSPASLDYEVKIDSQLVAAVNGLDLREVLAPSQWINAVVTCATDEHMVDLTAGMMKNPPQDERKEGDVPSPFVKPPQPVVLKGEQVKAADMVSAETLASDLGLDEISDLTEMTKQEQIDFYVALHKIDPDSVKLFPDPSKGDMPDNVYIMQGTAHLRLVEPASVRVVDIDVVEPMTMPFRTYVDMQPEGSDPPYWHVSAIYPLSSDIFGEHLTADHTLRLTLLKDSFYESNLRLTGGLDLGKLFSFIPGLAEKLGGATLSCTAPVAEQHSYQPFRTSFPTQMIAFLDFNDEGLEIADGHLHLRNIMFKPQVVPVLTAGVTERKVYASFSADAEVLISEDNSFSMCVSGAKLKDSAFVQGELTNWINPFGIAGIRVDSATILVNFAPKFSISSTLKFVVNSDLTIVLQGDWSKEDGLGLLGKVDTELTMEEILDVHKEVTGSKESLEPHSGTPAFQLGNVEVSLCSQEHDFGNDNDPYPAGLQVNACKRIYCTHCTCINTYYTHTPQVLGECTIDGADVKMKIGISAQDGLKFSGDVTNLQIGNLLTLEHATLDFEINPKNPENTMMQATCLKEVFSHDVELLCRFGKDKCVLGIMTDLGFKLSDIQKWLSFLDFTFPKLQYSVSTADLDVELNGKEIHIPKGQALTGVADFKFLKSLFGCPIPMAFTYLITAEQFVLMPGKEDLELTLKNGRLSTPDGLSFRIDMEKRHFGIQFATSFDLFKNHLQFAW